MKEETNKGNIINEGIKDYIKLGFNSLLEVTFTGVALYRSSGPLQTQRKKTEIKNTLITGRKKNKKIGN